MPRELEAQLRSLELETQSSLTVSERKLARAHRQQEEALKTITEVRATREIDEQTKKILPTLRAVALSWEKAHNDLGAPVLLWADRLNTTITGSTVAIFPTPLSNEITPDEDEYNFSDEEKDALDKDDDST